MSLSPLCKSQFRQNDRSRGEHVRHLVEIQTVTANEAVALVEGSHSEEYVVSIDYSLLADEMLGASCECMRFLDGYFCKHIWASIRELDDSGYSPALYDAKRLLLFEADTSPADTAHNRTNAPTSSDFANMIQEPVGPQEPRRNRRTSGRREPQWKSTLQQIASRKAKSPNPTGIPRETFQEELVETQYWFVLSIADVATERAFRVVLMESKRKKNRDWSRPVAAEISPKSVAKTVSPEEQIVFSLLKPIREAGRYVSYYQEETFRFFEPAEALLDESLAALHATGRFAWKLGQARHFEDAKPIDSIDCGPQWNVALCVAASRDSRTQLTVKLELRRDSQTIPISSVMWASESGCALVQKSDRPTDGAPPEGGTNGSTLDHPADDGADIETQMIKIVPQQAATIRAWQKAEEIKVPRRSVKTLLEQLARTHGEIDLEIEESIGVSQSLGTVEARCLLKQSERWQANFQATLLASYADRDFSFDSASIWWWDAKAKVVRRRDREAESRFLSQLPTEEFELVSNSWESDLGVSRKAFIQVVEKMQAAGWNVVADGAALRVATDFNIEVTTGIDWFDVDAGVDFDGVNASLPELLSAMRSGKNMILLDDGSFGMLPEAWLNRFVGLEASGEVEGNAIRFNRTQALLLDAMLAEQGEVKRDRSFTDFCQKLKSFEGVSPSDPPVTFSGTLREYQKLGLGWFRFLEEFRFGGCLADDMGLGKTIQVLALLEQRRKQRVKRGEKRKPSLVVVPKSLVFNWIDEASRFTPKLSLLNYTGTDRADRLADADAKKRNKPHLLVTTYGTMRNDVAMLREREFDYVILDEAQAIKNPKSLSAKAARLLRGDHRLAMTGTPVENHLGDLWSLFDFLNPGMLGPCVRGKLSQQSDEEDRRRLEQVSESLRPFILRRTKQQVLPELPDKVEQTLSCEMGDEQRRLYDQIRDHYRLHLAKKVKEVGLKRSKFHVLEALLRLRQAACDPRLVNPECGVTGAKIESLLQQLEEVITEGHKVLVFSQFTSLLGLVRDEVKLRGWDHEYLDGKTRKRAEKVKRFQEDRDCPLFLISLKAGGNGLNLTAADYVFVLDPWWNPAVEAQAIDRAHRIGQTQSVIAYRMICVNSVEEKIIDLQESKRDLADAIVSQDKSLISELTSDDLTQLLG